MDYLLKPKNSFNEKWYKSGDFPFVMHSLFNDRDYYLYAPNLGSANVLIFSVSYDGTYSTLHYERIIRNSSLSREDVFIRNLYLPIRENILRFNMVKRIKFPHLSWQT